MHRRQIPTSEPRAEQGPLRVETERQLKHTLPVEQAEPQVLQDTATADHSSSQTSSSTSTASDSEDLREIYYEMSGTSDDPDFYDR